MPFVQDGKYDESEAFEIDINRVNGDIVDIEETAEILKHHYDFENFQPSFKTTENSDVADITSKSESNDAE